MYFLVLDAKYNVRAIKALEVIMIGLGMERNPDMRNVMHARARSVYWTFSEPQEIRARGSNPHGFSGMPWDSSAKH